MSSVRTQTSYLVPQLSNAPPAPLKGTKLRKQAKQDRGGNVLPPLTGGSGYQAAIHTGLDAGLPSPGFGKTPRLLQHAKERRKERLGREGMVRGNMRVDENGIAHDSEYVQFRTATPNYQRQPLRPTNEEDDDDESVSSASSSETSPTTPYQSSHSHRASKQNKYSKVGTSSLHTYYGNAARTSIDSTLTVPSTPTARRTSGEYARRPPQQFTTSSYQPPAPAFNARLTGFGNPEPTLRLPTKAPSSADSLSESVAKLALSGESGGGSGYNKFESIRPIRMEGSALAAGTSGLKRSWDGFKLDAKFGIRSAGKKMERKFM